MRPNLQKCIWELYITPEKVTRIPPREYSLDVQLMTLNKTI